MPQSKYLVIGSSHAALEAVTAIRMQDPDGELTMITADPHLPYSPTVLPYVVSGRSAADNISLRDAEYFDQHRINYVTGRRLTSIDSTQNTLLLDNGEQWQYQRLLLATGATPAIPPVSGLNKVDYLVLRTLDDARALREASGRARKAVVLGAGLVGMHGAENLAEAGLEVTVVEMQSQVLPGYFDPQAAGLIESAFNNQGVRMLMEQKVVAVEPRGTGCRVQLQSGETLDADLLLVSTGVTPVIDYTSGSGIETDQGILVNDRMTTSVDNIWAAGDVAQGRDFYSEATVVTGILPDAVEQGRIAGMAMADDPCTGSYQGGVPINTYTFYGQQAISVGLSNGGDGDEISLDFDPDSGFFRKIILRDNRLQGISGVNAALDAGIMWQLILRRTDLSEVRDEFIAKPLETGRRLMSGSWR